jgi:hypothetical protein
VVDTDQVVSVSSKEIRSISGPGKGRAVGSNGVLSNRSILDLQLDHEALGLKIPDLDALSGGGAEPVAVRGEHKRVDDVARLQGVEALALSEVPEHGDAILATGSAQGSIGRDGHGVQVAGVAHQIRAKSAVGQRPHLDQLVPAGRHDDRSALGRGEAHAGNPVLVAVLLDGVLALTEGVPQLHGAVARARDDLSVVSAEGNGEHILGMVDEAAGAASGADLPQSQSAVPRARQSILSIRRDDNIRNEVVVSAERSAGVAVVSFLTGQSPHQDGLLKKATLTRSTYRHHQLVLHTLSRDADKIIEGSSAVVAIAVTQPLCPVKTPRKVN